LKILKKIVIGVSIVAALTMGFGFVQSHIDEPVQSARPPIGG
jgi:hypothetical protein